MTTATAAPPTRTEPRTITTVKAELEQARAEQRERATELQRARDAAERAQFAFQQREGTAEAAGVALAIIPILERALEPVDQRVAALDSERAALQAVADREAAVASAIAYAAVCTTALEAMIVQRAESAKAAMVAVSALHAARRKVLLAQRAFDTAIGPLKRNVSYASSAENIIAELTALGADLTAAGTKLDGAATPYLHGYIGGTVQYSRGDPSEGMLDHLVGYVE